jgi:WD40 repeat protein
MGDFYDWFFGTGFSVIFMTGFFMKTCSILGVPVLVKYCVPLTRPADTMPPCGKLLVADNNGVVHVKDMKDRLRTVREMRVFEPGTVIMSLCVYDNNKDNNRLVGVMATSEMKVFHYESGRVLFAHDAGSHGEFSVRTSWEEDSYASHKLVFSPSGDKVICSMRAPPGGHDHDGAIRMFSLATKGEVFFVRFPWGANGVNSLELSSNGKYLLTAGNDTFVTVWDVDKREKMVVFGDSETPVLPRHLWDTNDAVRGGTATFLDDRTVSTFTFWEDEHEYVQLVVDLFTGKVQEDNIAPHGELYKLFQPPNSRFPVAYVDENEGVLFVSAPDSVASQMRAYLHNVASFTALDPGIVFPLHPCVCLGGDVRADCPAVGHSKRVVDIVFPNPNYIVSVAEDNLVVLWNTARVTPHPKP